MGKYIYCITKSNNVKNLGPIGLGDSPQEVEFLSYKDLSAVISESPTKKYELSRKNLIGHQKVCEEVMKKQAVLPVKFATVADDEKQVLEQVLKAQYKKLKKLLEEFSDKRELGLKVIWSDIESVFSSLIEENSSLKKEKEILLKKDPGKTYFERAEFGQRVQKALNTKKKRLNASILPTLEELSTDIKDLPLHGDKMVVNHSFLVRQKENQKFDSKISAFTEQFKDVQFKYVGPFPPYNFLELVINLKDGSLHADKKGSRKAQKKKKAKESKNNNITKTVETAK